TMSTCWHTGRASVTTLMRRPGTMSPATCARGRRRTWRRPNSTWPCSAGTPPSSPGERFSYCNSGYVVLALIAERVSGVAFDQLVAERVCGPARMDDTGFLRSDELPAGTALGYLPIPGRSRTNVFHLPIRAAGTAGSTQRP